MANAWLMLAEQHLKNSEYEPPSPVNEPLPPPDEPPKPPPGKRAAEAATG
jgi:hypothetical protein